MYGKCFIIQQNLYKLYVVLYSQYWLSKILQFPTGFQQSQNERYRVVDLVTTIILNIGV